MFGLSGNQPIVAKASGVIQESVDQVFQYVGGDFFDHYPLWSPEVVELEALSEGPVRLGTLARQVRFDRGYRTESRFKVTGYQPNRLLRFEGVTDSYRCTYEFESAEPSGNATRVTFTFELLKLELHVRPFEKLVRTVIQDSTKPTVRNLAHRRRLILPRCSDAIEVTQRYEFHPGDAHAFHPRKRPRLDPPNSLRHP